jgi:hypothetical protein
MPLELVEIGTSAGIGIVDNVLVELEEQGKIKGNLIFVKDGIRLVGAFGGLAVNTFVARPGTLADKVSGALALSSLPLAIHSIRNLVKSVFKFTSGGTWVLEQVAPTQVQVPVQPIASPAVVTSY